MYKYFAIVEEVKYAHYLSLPFRIYAEPALFLFAPFAS